MNPEEFSEVLRAGEGLYLWCRRALVVTPFVSVVCVS